MYSHYTGQFLLRTERFCWYKFCAWMHLSMAISKFGLGSSYSVNLHHLHTTYLHTTYKVTYNRQYIIQRTTYRSVY